MQRAAHAEWRKNPRSCTTVPGSCDAGSVTAIVQRMLTWRHHPAQAAPAVGPKTLPSPLNPHSILLSRSGAEGLPKKHDSRHAYQLRIHNIHTRPRLVVGGTAIGSTIAIAQVHSIRSLQAPYAEQPRVPYVFNTSHIGDAKHHIEVVMDVENRR